MHTRQLAVRLGDRITDGRVVMVRQLDRSVVPHVALARLVRIRPRRIEVVLRIIVLQVGARQHPNVVRLFWRRLEHDDRLAAPLVRRLHVLFVGAAPVLDARRDEVDEDEERELEGNTDALDDPDED